LEEILASERKRNDLSADMFREILCVAEPCNYGTSPRVCFPSSDFKPLLPKLIAKWKAYAVINWGEDFSASDERNAEENK